MAKIYETRAEYDADHKVCPRCGGVPSFATYLDWVFRPGKPYRDRNHSECHCGWKGEVHDLAHEPKGSARSGGIFAMDRMPSKKQRTEARRMAHGKRRR